MPLLRHREELPILPSHPPLHFLFRHDINNTCSKEKYPCPPATAIPRHLTNMAPFRMTDLSALTFLTNTSTATVTPKFMSDDQLKQRASYRVFNTPELLENILLKTMELPVINPRELNLHPSLKLTMWNRTPVCAQMKTLLMSQRVCVAFRRTIQLSDDLQRELYLLPPAEPLGFLRLNPLFSSTKNAYSEQTRFPFISLVVRSSPHAQLSMHLRRQAFEERHGSWQQMRVCWTEEWESYVNYSKTGSHSSEVRFMMQFPGCPSAGEILKKVKQHMKETCSDEEQAEMFG